jgi:hypothetical protein
MITNIWFYFTRWLLRRDRCETCDGTQGVRGNENLVGGTVLCDYCHAKWFKKEVKPMNDTTFFNCERCGKPVNGQYASVGGNGAPFIEPKYYHLGCVPSVKEYKS